MPPDTISSYLRSYGADLGDRVLAQFPPLHGPDDPVSEYLRTLVPGYRFGVNQ